MQHAVVHTEVCQPDRMALVSLTGSLTSSIRLSAWASSPAFLSALCCRYQRRGYQPYRVYIPRHRHAGQDCPRRRLSVLVWRLWFGLAMDVELPRAVLYDDATHEQQSTQRDVPK